jgi:Ti-type conjugative transfer relaxase TraA
VAGGHFHLSAKVISRGEGRSAVAAAAYRSGSELVDEHSEETFDYTRKEGVEHSEILAPKDAPEWVHDRARLWNEVEQREVRKDAQLARELEIGLPKELSKDEQIALIRDFAERELVARGMVVDLNVHRDNEANPHAHLMLTMRSIGREGFGPKVREWNDRALLMQWREAWAERANEHLARAGHDVRIDHRSHAERGIELVPQSKIGVGRHREGDPTLPDYVVERIEQHRQIARENGERIIADPAVALKAITHHQATFTEHDLVKFLHTRTEGAEQFQTALVKVKASEQRVSVGTDERGKDRFTTREMLEVERGMLERAERMAGADSHAVSERHRSQALAEGVGRTLSEQQRAAFEHVTGKSDLAVVVGVAGSGKSTLLGVSAKAWEAEGLTPKGAALSGLAAENLETSSGIGSRTLASWERSWELGRDTLTKKDVLVIDEAGLVGSRQLSRVLEHAEKAGAKVVLVGDPEQLQAIEAGAPFRGIAARQGYVELTDVRRQREAWQREATQALSSGRTVEALSAYRERGGVEAFADRGAARSAMLQAWRGVGEDTSRLMLAYTRADVRALNEEAREIRRAEGQLGAGERVETSRGEREFASGDRITFLRNERSLGVKNGTLGTVETISDGVLQVRLDGAEARRLAVDTRGYADLDHGYAATVHKSQGATVDRTFVLATPHFDRHATYVAMSRHRDGATLYYGEEDFRGKGAEASRNLDAVLSRARPKELAFDYLEREGGAARSVPTPSRGRFAGLKLSTEASAPTAGRGALNDAALTVAVERFAKARVEANAMAREGQALLPHQQAEIRRTTQALEALRPGAERQFNAAMLFQPESRRVLELEAPARAPALLRAMDREAAISTQPRAAAERLVERWTALETRHRELGAWSRSPERAAVRAELGMIVDHLKRDPDAGAVLREARGLRERVERDSVLGKALGARDVAKALERGLETGGRAPKDPARDRDHGFER